MMQKSNSLLKLNSNVADSWSDYEESGSGSDSNSNKISTKKPIKFLKVIFEHICEWKNCNHRSKIYNDFLSHIKKHSDKTTNFICEWGQCNVRTENLSAFKHHVNYHAYYKHLIEIGQSVLNTCQLPKCLEDANYFIPVFDPHLLLCEWNDCNGDFVETTNFLEHVKFHVRACKKTVLLNLKCAWFGCGQSFKNRSRLEDHLRIHTKEKLVACPTCFKLFSTKTKFFDHRKRQLAVDLHPYHCSQCAKSFASVRLLRNHMQRHINNYKCHLCDMTCPVPSTLSRHIRYKHLNSRMFKCYFCQKKFVSKYDLECHLSTHFPDIVSKCELCEFTCRSSATLDKHYIEIHKQGSGKIYECHCCQKQFRRGDILTKHLVRKHDFKRVPGHSRYRYIQDLDDGKYRLETVRLDSIEVTEKIVHEAQMKQQQQQQDQLNSNIDLNNQEVTLVENSATNSEYPTEFRVEISRN